MATRNQESPVRVEYRDGRIELSGERAALSAETERVLRRFRFSARPYHLSRIDGRPVGLTPCQ